MVLFQSIKGYKYIYVFFKISSSNSSNPFTDVLLWQHMCNVPCQIWVDGSSILEIMIKKQLNITVNVIKHPQ